MLILPAALVCIGDVNACVVVDMDATAVSSTVSRNGIMVNASVVSINISIAAMMMSWKLEVSWSEVLNDNINVYLNLRHR